jgi:hypothetical protein
VIDIDNDIVNDNHDDNNFGGFMHTHRLTGNLKAGAGIRFLAMLVILLTAGLFAYAQQITGTLVGTVQDSQGAVVSNAKVTVTSVDTGLTHETVSNGQGEYRVEYLAVGNYEIAVEAQGFKKFLQKNIVVLVDQTITVNANLAIGAQTETVIVSEAPPLVNTSTAEIGRTVEADEITALPLPNRNPYTQLSLTPGVLSSSASGGGGNPSASGANYNQVVGLPSTQVIINGGFDGGVGSVSFYLDGGVNMTGIRNYGNPAPNPDALQEFRVETNNYAAQYGRFGAGVVTLVTRSGSNKFHGSLFEFDRNTILNDTPWNSPTNPLTNKVENQPYHRNQFGGTVGGPIRSNKTFFFFSAAALRQIVDNLESGAIVPTALERQGDFTQSPTLPTNPAHETIIGGTNTGGHCGTAGTAGCISTSSFDPTAVAILNAYIPQPNVTNGVKINGAATATPELNGWAGFSPSPYTNNEYLAKIDHQFSDSNHLAASYFRINSQTTVAGGGNILWSAQTDKAAQDNVNISDTQMLKSGLINQTWFSYTRNLGGRSNAPMPPIAGSGFTSLDSFQTLASAPNGLYALDGPPSLPQLTVTGFFTLGQSIEGPVAGSNFYSVRDVASKSIGKHSLDIGAEMSLDKDVQITDLNNYGTFSFSTSAPETSGNALADYLLGNPYQMEQDTIDYAISNSWYYAFFVQDSFRATSRLTLNLGLRYDFQTPPTDNGQNRESTFSAVDARNSGHSTVFPNAPSGMLFAGDAGVRNGTTSMKFHHISPRIGLAYDPFGDGKTSIRAAAGIFYGGASGNEWNATSNFAPYAYRQAQLGVASLSNVYGTKYANGAGAATSFPGGNVYPSGPYTNAPPNGTPIFPYVYNPSNPGIGAIFPAASNEEGIALNFQWPYTYQFNASIQRQLHGDASITIAYVGAYSHDLPFQRDVNYAGWTPGAISSPTNSAAGYGYNSRHPYDNEYNNHTSTNACPTVLFGGVQVPVPNCSLGQVQLVDSEATASYNALQISGNKRMSHHFVLSGFYVWGKAFQSQAPGGETIGTIPQDFSTVSKANGGTERAVTNFDQKQTASLSGIWDISYYHGGNKALKGVINGWQISPIVTLNSGIPLNILSGTNGNDDGESSATDRANYVPGVVAKLDPHRPRLGPTGSATQWFNPNAFVANGCQTTYNNSYGMTNPCYVPTTVGTGPGGADGDVPFNAFRDPGYRDVDLGVFKTTDVWRGAKIQFRAEATNAFNMVSLAAPGATGANSVKNFYGTNPAKIAPSSSFGVITAQQGSQRVIQLGARLTF